MTRVVSVRARLRGTTVIAASAALVAAGLLVPGAANAVSAPQTKSNVLGGTSLSADGWTGPATDPASGYDFSTNNGVLQASNVGANGVITPLESPTTQEAGEPGYTSASFDAYHIAFTLDGHAAGSNKYAAQPGVSLEVDADEGGNRAGGGMYFSVPSNNVLEIDNFSSTDPFGDLWAGATKRITFKAPVAIDYTVKFVAGGTDVITVKANGTTVLSTGAGTYEGYSFGVAANDYTSNSAATTPDADVVDQVLFRGTSNVFNTAWTPANTDPSVAPWAPVSGTVPTTPGGGFTFSKLTYGALHSGGAAFADSSVVSTAASAIANYEDASTYNNWHIGSNDDPTDTNHYFDVLSNGNVQLNDFNASDAHSTQLLHGIATNQPTDLYALVAKGLAWTLPTSNFASYQIALTGANVGTGGQFTTLHSQSDTEHTGLNLVRLSDPWVSTRAIGDIPAQTVEPLGTLLAALEPNVANDSSGNEPTAAITAADVDVVGFGVANEANAGQSVTDVGPVYFGGVKYTFAAARTITLGVSTVTGTAAVGRVLTGSVPTVTPVDAALSYQWLRNGVAISGARGTTHTVATADYGRRLSLRVTARVTGDTTKTTTSAQTAKVVFGTFASTGSVVVNGGPNVGEKLTITRPTYSPAPTSYAYQWLRNGIKISHATASSYVLAPADLGTTISVSVAAKRSYYSSLSLTSDPTATVIPGVLAVTAAPTIKGTLKSGMTLTASSGGWTGNTVATSSVTKRYFWFVSDGTGIPDLGDLVQVGTSSTLKLAYWAQGLKVSVYVTGVEDGYTSATSTFSVFTAIVQ
ncbi:MAG TPA: hypothetical protein VHZ81_02155 [Galbitalea sp.]|jgi:hypothetical protein|nr:hypothetical protein [Galbitalea sp.]